MAPIVVGAAWNVTPLSISGYFVLDVDTSKVLDWNVQIGAGTVTYSFNGTSSVNLQPYGISPSNSTAYMLENDCTSGTPCADSVHLNYKGAPPADQSQYFGDLELWFISGNPVGLTDHGGTVPIDGMEGSGIVGGYYMPIVWDGPGCSQGQYCSLGSLYNIATGSVSAEVPGGDGAAGVPEPSGVTLTALALLAVRWQRRGQ